MTNEVKQAVTAIQNNRKPNESISDWAGGEYKLLTDGRFLRDAFILLTEVSI